MVFIWWQCDKWTTNARMATIHHYIRLKRSFNTNCGGKSLDVLNDSRVCKCIVKLRSERARSALCPGILISLDNSNPTSFDGLISVQVCFISEYHAQQTTLRGILISVQVQMRDVDSSAAGWSVAGATVIASHGKGTWKRLVAIGQQPAAQAVSGEMARLEVRATASCSSPTQTGRLVLGGGADVARAKCSVRTCRVFDGIGHRGRPVASARRGCCRAEGWRVGRADVLSVCRSGLVVQAVLQGQRRRGPPFVLIDFSIRFWAWAGWPERGLFC
jgi:hypothetical protein